MLFIDWRPTATAAINARVATFVFSSKKLAELLPNLSVGCRLADFLKKHANFNVYVAYRTDGIFLFWISGFSGQNETLSSELSECAAELSHLMKLHFGHQHIFHFSPRLGELDSGAGWSNWSERERRQFIFRRYPIYCQSDQLTDEIRRASEPKVVAQIIARIASDNEAIAKLQASSILQSSLWSCVPAISRLREYYSKIFDRVFHIKRGAILLKCGNRLG